ncbi:hypothetical protein ACQKNX_10165 [Lysinibacillus sp. NPDC093712]|uniref:hypothetical protein n=1 Tax=Lysinibacillus sp. NPDC093712 TaxID=3390579 RepID=UPI003D04E987
MKRLICSIIALTFIGVVNVFSVSTSAAELALSQEQKEKYYQQYLNDLQDLQSHYIGQEVLNVTVANVEYFEKNGWIEPSQFKTILNEVMTSKIVVSNEAHSNSLARKIVTSITKSFNITNTTGHIIGRINAIVTPQSAYDSDRDGMVLTSPGTITTAKGWGAGSWSQTHAGVSHWPQGQPYTHFGYSIAGNYTYQGVVIPFTTNFTVSISKNGALY